MPSYQFPTDRVTPITDDAEAKAIMLEYDVLDQVSRQTNSDDTISACIVENHPTHWLMCCRFWNNPNPAENGFALTAYPKAAVDRLTVQQKLHELLFGGTRVEVRPFFPGATQN